MNLWTNGVYPLLSSKAASSSIAIVAAAAGFMIYFMRRRDHKRDAANIILLELKHSVRKLNEARVTYEDGQTRNPPAIIFPEKLRLMPTSSWSKYKYLFVRNLEPEQWEMIGTYYENCKAFDEAIEHRDRTFELNETEIRAGIQRNISSYAKELASLLKDNPSNDVTIDSQNQKIKEEVGRLSNLAVRSNITDLVYLYNPDKSFNDASYHFNLLPANIVETPTGQVIRRLAGIKKLN